MEKKVIKVDFTSKKRVDEKSTERNHNESLTDFEKQKHLKGFEELKKFVREKDGYSALSLYMKLSISGTMIPEKIKEIERNTNDFSQNALDSAKNIVRSYTNDQLIHEFTESDSAQWHKNPAFYRAIANEIHDRIKMLMRDLNI